MEVVPAEALWERLPKPVRFDFAASTHVGSGHGWSWRIQPTPDRGVRRIQFRTVDVLMAASGSQPGALPPECTLAIDTAGLSAVEAVLHMADPPRAIVVTNEGLEYQYGPV